MRNIDKGMSLIGLMVCAAFIAACGGGGGSTPPATNTGSGSVAVTINNSGDGTGKSGDLRVTVKTCGGGGATLGSAPRTDAERGGADIYYDDHEHTSRDSVRYCIS
ncbi:MAG: hypothetical protein AABZ15_02035 [Nitrospirota bacterium]